MSGDGRIEEVQEMAPAKINLSLDVTGKLDNGYHSIESIMQTVDLCDELSVKKIEAGIKICIRGKREVPDDENNLAWQAAKLMKENFASISSGVEIHLRKNIPVSAGLAGGSSDAAAVLRALNRLFSLGLTREKLEQLGVELGADVPFCIRGGTALARGRGEKLTFYPGSIEQKLILLNPELKVSTARIFSQLKPALIEESSISADSLIENSISTGNKITWQEGWENILERVTTRLYPGMKDLRDRIKNHDPAPVHVQMTGSGPTFMIFHESEREMREFAETWPGGEELILTRFISGAKVCPSAGL